MHIIDFLAANTAFFIAYCVVVGLLVGSFLNVVIYRLPIMLERSWRSECQDLLEIDHLDNDQKFNLITPRSRCPHCNHLITALENIPNN